METFKIRISPDIEVTIPGVKADINGYGNLVIYDAIAGENVHVAFEAREWLFWKIEPQKSAAAE